MPRKKYTSEFKTKIVLSILQGDKEFNVICSENGLNPNMVRKWKQEFLQNAHLAFGAELRIMIIHQITQFSFKRYWGYFSTTIRALTRVILPVRISIGIRIYDLNIMGL